MKLLLLMLAACGSHAGDDDMMAIDAPISTTPTMITISGSALEQGQSGSTPVAGATIGLYKISDENTALATATSDAQGKYTMTVTATGALDVFVKATKTSYVDSYLYPSAPITADYAVDCSMLTSSTYNLLVTFAGASAGHGLITMVVLDSNAQPVKDAKVSSMPAAGAYRYSDSSGYPQSSTATNTDGLSFMFDVPPGMVTVSATKSGMTFKSHALMARADKFTTTSIAP